jgi:sterol desaturase/sphingolipid hydroxylase (fatty acid hydroxylase superfamily)
VTAITVNAFERPLVTRLARYAESHGLGIQRLALPRWAKTALAAALMDYTLYWWHVLLHRVPALWRLHEPHHADRDLDASTALRFHFAEFVASVPWRCAQVLLIGVDPRSLALWQRLTLLEVLFHHSNVRLPRQIEQRLARLVVTPRLHGLHHSIVREERDSNFSSGLTLWDRLHGTADLDLQRSVTIGLPDHRTAASLPETLALPFRRG